MSFRTTRNSSARPFRSTSPRPSVAVSQRQPRYSSVTSISARGSWRSGPTTSFIARVSPSTRAPCSSSILPSTSTSDGTVGVFHNKRTLVSKMFRSSTWQVRVQMKMTAIRYQGWDSGISHTSCAVELDISKKRSSTRWPGMPRLKPLTVSCVWLGYISSSYALYVSRIAYTAGPLSRRETASSRKICKPSRPTTSRIASKTLAARCPGTDVPTRSQTKSRMIMLTAQP
mmetsp:Transcript_115660/g.369067  ORF Transcript_115660/g.369067 Transcript_115660/m.369067 type:complete len:229 (+) Transcript_115660:290-976(+)